MSNRFPAFPADVPRPENLGTGLERFGELEDLVNAAQRAGIVDETVGGETAGGETAGDEAVGDQTAAYGDASAPPGAQARRLASPTQVPALVADLRLLGYLGGGQNRARPRAGTTTGTPLHSAVVRFQQDADLEVDGKAGEQTWAVLRRLITFEANTGVDDFLHNGQASPALARAVRLRLYALGILRQPPDPSPASDQLPLQALTRFWQIAVYLGFGQGEAPGPIGLVRLLLDQDRIVKGISDSPRIKDETKDRLEGFRLVHPDGDPLNDATLRLLQRFLVCVAKVELWLLGFDIDIDRKLDYPVLGVRIITPRSGRLKQTLQQFWQELAGQSEVVSKKMIRFITPALFQALARIEIDVEGGSRPPSGAALADARPTVMADDASRLVLESVGKRRRSIAKAWAQGKSLRMRVWDGLQRVWRWLARGFKRILRIGRNLARAFYAFIRKAFQIVRFAVRTTAKTLGQYLGAQIQTGKNNPVTVRIAGDGDIRVTIPAQADPADVEQASRYTTYFGTAFSFSIRLLGTLLKTVTFAAGALASGVIGWARWVWILVRSYRELRPIWRELRAIPVPQGW